MKFNTVLYKVLSPQNVGMIIRSHVAFGGGDVIFVGYDKPWDFKKGSQAFSRKLEERCTIIDFFDEEKFFVWSAEHRVKNIAIEIDNNSTSLHTYKFTANSNLIVGSEGKGLPQEFIQRCDDSIYIPQYGQVECLNVAVAASIVLFNFASAAFSHEKKIAGTKFEV